MYKYVTFKKTRQSPRKSATENYMLWPIRGNSFDKNDRTAVTATLRRLQTALYRPTGFNLQGGWLKKVHHLLSSPRARADPRTHDRSE